MTDVALRRIKIKKKSLYYDKDIPFKCMVFFYKFVHVVFCLDFGFIECKFLGVKSRKILTFIQSVLYYVISISSLYFSTGKHHKWWFSLAFIKYVLYVLMLMRIKRETIVCNSIQSLRAIDSGLNVNKSSHYLEIKLFISILICITFRVWMLTTFFEHVSDEIPFRDNIVCMLLHGWIDLIVHLSADIVRISYAFIFFAINCRLKDLKQLLKTKQSGFLSMQYLYRSIVDIAEQHKEAFDLVLISSVLFNIPQAMMIMFDRIVKIREAGILSVDSVMSIITGELLLLTILPAICAGFLSSQVKQIKVILHDILLKQQEYSAQYRELERFISYVEVRGCRFHVCKLMPLDASLLGMVVSFCVTYLIVIIQFTYKN